MLELNPLIKTLAKSARSKKVIRFFYNEKWREGEVYSFKGELHSKELCVNIYQTIPSDRGHIQSFRVTRMVSVEITDKAFIPRWQIDVDFEAIQFLEDFNGTSDKSVDEEVYKCDNCGSYCSYLDIRCENCKTYFDLV